VCIECDVILNKDNWTKSCKKYLCRSCNNKRQKKYKENVKRSTIIEYGGKCVCCNEKHIEFLTIDHIDGAGSKHRNELLKIKGWKRKDDSFGGTDFYLWLKNNEYPKDNYQVLCFNCNAAKHIYGICPHNA
jgi:hypothetical protein